MQYFYSLDGNSQRGPLDAAGLKAAGVGPGTMVWCEGMPDWQQAATVPELAGLFPPVHAMPPAPLMKKPPLPPVHSGSGTNGYAIASLVCGVLGLVGGWCCPAFVFSVLAVIFGHIGRGQIRRGIGSGGALALAGLILGYAGLVMGLIGFRFTISDRGFGYEFKPFRSRSAGTDRAMRDLIRQARSLVVKIGSQTLTGPDKRLDAAFLAALAGQIGVLRGRGVRVTVVSSGAIAAGLGELGLAKRPTDLAKLQAVAAVGQRRLMDAWAEAFSPHGLAVGQILLTREDIDHRKRFLNLRNTTTALHALNAVPVINENDTISTDEIVRISFGDNDILAAHVAAALRADVLVLLSNVDGVLDAAGRPVRTIDDPVAARSMIRADKSHLGTGGMDSKFAAADMVTGAGESMVVARGRDADVLVRLLDGDDLGTAFLPQRTARTAGRRRWIGAARPGGAVVVDDGAATAIRNKNVSLLPAGVTRVRGAFEKGDVIAVETAGGDTVAHGLTNYSAADVESVRGLKSVAVRQLLHDRAYDEVIHRDNLVKRHAAVSPPGTPGEG